MIAETYPLELRRRLERLMRFAFGNVFNRVYQPTFSRVAAAAGPVTLIYDTFTDVNGTALTAHTIAPTNTTGTSWTFVGTSSFDIQSNRANSVAAEGTTGEDGVAIVNAGVADCVISATMNGDLNVSPEMGLSYRTTDTNNYWAAFMQVDNVVNIYECTSGSRTRRASAAYSYTTGDHIMILTLAGDVATVGIDSTPNVVAYTSSVRNTVTNHGLAVRRIPIRHDNFKVI